MTGELPARRIPAAELAALTRAPDELAKKFAVILEIPQGDGDGDTSYTDEPPVHVCRVGDGDQWTISDIIGRCWHRELGWVNTRLDWADTRQDPPDDADFAAMYYTLAEVVALMFKPTGPEPPGAPQAPFCGKCAIPFTPDDPRWDGHARYKDTEFCRHCTDWCHEATDAFHRCVICATPGEYIR